MMHLTRPSFALAATATDIPKVGRLTGRAPVTLAPRSAITEARPRAHAEGEHDYYTGAAVMVRAAV